jgi:sec-independent protein translocase protein TatA
MDIPGPVELIIIGAVVLILFGSKKMPDAARSLGRSLRIFKAETKGLHDDETQPPTAAAQPPTTATQRSLPTTTEADGTPVNGRHIVVEHDHDVR